MGMQVILATNKYYISTSILGLFFGYVLYQTWWYFITGANPILLWIISSLLFLPLLGLVIRIIFKAARPWIGVLLFLLFTLSLATTLIGIKVSAIVNHLPQSNSIQLDLPSDY
jgi:hypothetical protein